MSRERRLVTLITVAAFVLRLAWVLSVSRDGFPYADPLMYHVAAKNLIAGNGYSGIMGIPMVHWPPGYSVVLAGVYWVFGTNPVNGEILNALVGALTVPLLYVTVRRAFNHRVAVIAAVMLCVMPGPILWSDMLVTETIYTCLFVGFMALAVRLRPSWKTAAFFGAYIGLSSLLRGEALVWVPVLMVLWFRPLGWRRMLAHCAALFAVIALVLTPWTIRNERVFHSFIPLALNSGDTLWAGHNPAATGTQNYPSKELLLSIAGDTPEPQRTVVIAKGMQREAIHFMLHHPLAEAKLVPAKLIALMRGDSYAFDWLNLPPYRTLGTTGTMYVGVIADFAWFSLLALCIIGVVGLGRRTWRTPLLRAIRVSFLTGLVLYGFLYYGNYRYRLPYEPLMMVVAALVLERMWHALRSTESDETL